MRIYHSQCDGWVEEQDGIEYPVLLVPGGYTWTVKNTTIEVVLECNFVPFTFFADASRLEYITGPDGEWLDEFWFSADSSHLDHLFKERTVDGEIDRVRVGKRWDRQRYGSEEGRRTAQEKYTLG